MPSPLSVAVVAIAALVVAGAVLLVLIQPGDSELHPRTLQVIEGPVGGPRAGLAWCVETVGLDPTYAVKAKAAIEAVFAEIVQLEELYFNDFVPDHVDLGCPVGPVVFGNTGCGFVDFDCSRKVRQAGRYTAFFYLLPDREIERIGPANRETDEESEWHGDAGSEVSKGIYLSPNELNDEDFLRYWTYQGAGLDCFLPTDLDLPFPTPEPCPGLPR